jgi:hypothetical protein
MTKLRTESFIWTISCMPLSPNPLGLAGDYGVVAAALQRTSPVFSINGWQLNALKIITMNLKYVAYVYPCHSIRAIENPFGIESWTSYHAQVA